MATLDKHHSTRALSQDLQHFLVGLCRWLRLNFVKLSPDTKLCQYTKICRALLVASYHPYRTCQQLKPFQAIESTLIARQMDQTTILSPQLSVKRDIRTLDLSPLHTARRNGHYLMRALSSTHS